MEKGKGKIRKLGLIITEQLKRTAAEDARDIVLRSIPSGARRPHGTGAMSTARTIPHPSRTRVIVEAVWPLALRLL